MLWVKQTTIRNIQIWWFKSYEKATKLTQRLDAKKWNVFLYLYYFRRSESVIGCTHHRQDIRDKTIDADSRMSDVRYNVWMLSDYRDHANTSIQSPIGRRFWRCVVSIIVLLLLTVTYNYQDSHSPFRFIDEDLRWFLSNNYSMITLIIFAPTFEYFSIDVWWYVYFSECIFEWSFGVSMVSF